MNKYLVELGELGLKRISEYFIVYSKDSIESLQDNGEFLHECDETFCDMYYNYGEDDEDMADFIENMGIISIKNWKEEYNSYTSVILYDERDE